MAKKSTPSSNGWAGSVEEWHGRSLHHIELLSGMKIDMRFCTLGELISQGDLPDDLLKLALAEYAEADQPGGGVTRMIREQLEVAGDDTATEEERAAAETQAAELGRQAAALVRAQVAYAVVSPALTVEQLADPRFPQQDLEMIAGILNRRVSFDAAGRRIGVEPLDTFATFLQEHECQPDCSACQASRDRLSTVHAGAL